MSKQYEHRIPQFGANDDEVLITDIFCQNNEKVSKGDTLGAFEATKISFEIEAETDGYFYSPHSEGESIETSALFCVISDESGLTDWESFFTTSKQALPQEDTSPTKKALLLIRKHGLDKKNIPYNGERLTGEDVSVYLKKTPLAQDVILDIDTSSPEKKIAIIGAGPSAPVLIDAMALNPNQVPTIIFDDNAKRHGTKIHGVPVVGPISEAFMESMHNKGYFEEVIIAINSSVELRSQFYETMKRLDYSFANVIHPEANISDMARIGSGNVVLQFCNISPQASIGDNNYFSAYTSIEHDCTLQDNCSFGPGVMTSGNVSIGSNVKFGTGVFIEPHIKIGSNATIASGAIIVRDVAENVLVKSRELLDHRAK